MEILSKTLTNNLKLIITNNKTKKDLVLKILNPFLIYLILSI